MVLKNSYDKKVGVIGAGSFGTAVSNILAENNPVLLYSRKPEVARQINETRINSGQKLQNRITVTDDLELIADQCEIIFPIVPSENFRSMMQQLSPFLHPYHILIHGTKGLEMVLSEDEFNNNMIVTREHIRTMSEVIQDESVVVRIGCLAGPNLAKELSQSLPAATVVASHFDEVIAEGQRLLRSDRFQVYGSKDLIGVELSGVLKNIIAIASGAVSGLQLGENARALLISRGMVEMIYLGKVLGGNIRAFIGLAGIGDLIATCTSPLSRNYSVGYRMAKGEKIDHIINTMEETAEGINTIKIIKRMMQHYKTRAPITEMLYRVLFEDLTVEEALQYLMKYPFNVDVDFI